MRSLFQKKLRGTDEEKITAFFLTRRIFYILLFLAFYALYAFSAELTNFANLPLQLSRIPVTFLWFFKNFLPNKASLSYLPKVTKSVFTTVSAAVSSTTLSAIVSFFLSLLTSEITKTPRLLKYFITLLLSFLRNLPLVAWSILLLLSFKQNEFTGFLCLFLITTGHLSRIFRGLIDESSKASFYALSSMGLPYIIALTQGVIPSISSELLSWLLFAIESNVRDSALVGILTGSGIGFLFNLYFRSFRYREAGLLVMILLFFVLLFDFLTNKIRKFLL